MEGSLIWDVFVSLSLLLGSNGHQGYNGKGYELRARRTWPLYPPETRAALIELPIHLPSWLPKSMNEWDNGIWEGREECPIKEGTFLIGNHADEITVRGLLHS